MLTVIGVNSPLQVTKGQYVQQCCLFRSTKDLTVEQIRVKTALFSQGSPIDQNFTYQSPYTTGQMSFRGAPNSENYKAELEVIDNFTYRICYSFLIGADNNGFFDDSNTNVQNSNFITGSGPAYGAGSSIAIYSQVGADASTGATCRTAVQVNDFCNFEYTLYDDNGEEITGYNSGQDLKIDFNILGDANSLFYAGFIDETGIGNASGLIDDLGLNYALMFGNTALAQDGLPTDCLIGSESINSDGQNSKGSLTLSGSCLTSGCYRAYIVYKQDGQWKSCITGQICKADASNQVIKGDVTQTITQGAQTTVLGCVQKLNDCQPIEICGELDIASYDANLASLGIGGTATDYFQEIRVQADNGILSTTSNGVIGACVTYTPTSGQVGTTRVSINYVFVIDGVEQIISQAIDLIFNTVVGATTPTFTDGGDVVTDTICAETCDDISFTKPDPNCQAFLFLGDQLIKELTGDIVSCEDLDLGVCYDIKFLCQETVDESPCMCPECGDIQSILTASRSGDIDNFSIQVPGLSAGSITAVVGSDTFTANASNLTFFFEDCPTDSCTYFVDIKIVDANGCEYAYALNVTVNETGVFSETETLFGTGNEIGCPCDPEIDCSGQFISILTTCDPDTHTITVTDDISSITDVIVSDSGLEQSTDNTNWNPAAASITGENTMYYRRTIITENCGEITAFETVTCIERKDCSSNRQITHTIVADCLLQLTLVDTINEPILSDKLYVTIDGVQTEYDPPSSYVPVLIEEGQEVVYGSDTILDGCPDLKTPRTRFTVDKDDLPCDGFAGYDLQCVADAENCTFTITYTGDPLLLSDNNYPTFNLNGQEGKVLQSPLVIASEGVLITRWDLRKPGCEDECLQRVCSIKSEVEKGIGDINIVNNTCCGCACTAVLACENCILTITTDGADCGDVMWTVTGPGGYNIGGLIHNLDGFPSGVYTATGVSSDPDCDDIVIDYTHDAPDAPNAISQPPIQ